MTTNTNATANNAVETVAIPSSVFTTKRVALGLGVSALAVAAWYGYKLYKGTKVVVEVVTDGEATQTEEAPAEA